MPQPRLILASASPRRRELLHAAGYAFEVHPANIDEDDFPADISPIDLATRLASQKAETVAQQFAGDVVLAADTVVTFGERILGKPNDAADAQRMLELLSGTTHIVITGISIVHATANFDMTTRCLSAVRMKALSPTQIRRYVESNMWHGKAGGYGIQDPDPFVTRMSGSHTNVVGLPMEEVTRLLSAAGIQPEAKK